MIEAAAPVAEGYSAAALSHLQISGGVLRAVNQSYRREDEIVKNVIAFQRSQ